MTHHAWIIEPSGGTWWIADANGRHQVQGTARANDAGGAFGHAVTAANAKQLQIISVQPLPTGRYIVILAG